MSIESVMPSNHLGFSCPLLLLPSIFPTIRVFSNQLAVCIRGPNYWSFSSSISPSKEYSIVISCRIDWFDLLIVQDFLISPRLIVQGLSRVFSNTTVQNHQFFGVQLSLWSNSHIHNDHWKNHSSDQMDLLGRGRFI